MQISWASNKYHVHKLTKMLCNNFVYKCIFQEIKSRFKSKIHVFYGFLFIWFSTRAVFGKIEPIVGSLSPLLSVDASKVEVNNSFLYSRCFVLDIFSQRNFVSLSKNLFASLFPISCCGLSVIWVIIII